MIFSLFIANNYEIRPTSNIYLTPMPRSSQMKFSHKDLAKISKLVPLDTQRRTFN